MGVLVILADSIALMIGSLLVAGLLTFSAWWVADRFNRPWAALIVLLALFAGMLASPLESSLFVRMVAVFGIVGTGLLYFVGRGEEAMPAEKDSTSSRRP